MIRLENIEKVYRTNTVETVALSNINLNIEEGHFISIMGPSGSGKSTLLNVIGLLDVPTGGRLSLNGDWISSYNDRYLARIRNQQIGFVFQTFHLISDLNVVDNVEIPLLYRRLSGSVRRKMALEALERVGLTSRSYHFPTQLSGRPTTAGRNREGDCRTTENSPGRRANREPRQPDGRRHHGDPQGPE